MRSTIISGYFMRDDTGIDVDDSVASMKFTMFSTSEEEERDIRVSGNFTFVSQLFNYKLSGTFKTEKMFFVDECVTIWPLTLNTDRYITMLAQLQGGWITKFTEADSNIETFAKRSRKAHEHVKNVIAPVYFHYDLYNSMYKLIGDNKIFTCSLDSIKKLIQVIDRDPPAVCFGLDVPETKNTHIKCNDISKIEEFSKTTFTDTVKNAISVFNDLNNTSKTVTFNIPSSVRQELIDRELVIVNEINNTLITKRQHELNQMYLERLYTRDDIPVGKPLRELTCDSMNPEQVQVLKVEKDRLFQITGIIGTGKTFVGTVIAKNHDGTLVITKSSATTDAYKFKHVECVVDATDSDAEKTINQHIQNAQVLIVEDAQRFSISEFVRLIPDNKKFGRIVFIGDDRVVYADDGNPNILATNKELSITTYTLTTQSIYTKNTIVSSGSLKYKDIKSIGTVPAKDTIYKLNTDDTKTPDRIVEEINGYINPRSQKNVIWVTGDRITKQKLCRSVRKHLLVQKGMCVDDHTSLSDGDITYLKPTHRTTHDDGAKQNTVYKVGRIFDTMNGSKKRKTCETTSDPVPPGMDKKLKRHVKIKLGKRTHTVSVNRLQPANCLTIDEMYRNNQTHQVIVLYKCDVTDGMAYSIARQASKKLVIVEKS